MKFKSCLKSMAFIYLMLCNPADLAVASRTSCKGFKSEKNNQENPNWILIGEDHSEAELTSQCVDKVTANIAEHVILVESVPAGQVVPCEDHGINAKQGRICKGWDDEEAMDKNNILYAKLIHGPNEWNRLVKHLKDLKLSDDQIDIYIKDVLKNTKGMVNSAKTDKQMKKKIDLRHFAVIDIIDNMLAKRETKKSYSKIFKKNPYPNYPKADKLPPKPQKESDSINRTRNKSLIKTLNRHNNLFTVVVAGDNHLSDEGYVQQELQKGKHGNRYALLRML